MSHKGEKSHTQATSTYDMNAQNLACDQRELEARILLKSNRMIQQLITMWDERPNDLLEETLKYNRQIWLLFYDTAMDDQKNSRPDALRNNIINLANFIFKREIDILANPAKEKLGILLNINHEISAGLMENTAQTSQDNQV
ncbi:MAG: flagellar FlaF family protein [Alphaproteobacteria bacterium]|nr:flagellar FlaF family protein [Alphaproteobacteria bacterium]